MRIDNQCIVALVALALAVPALAAESKEPAAPVDMPMPESPAATALGVADTAVLKPATSRDLAVSLSRLAGRGGKANAGVSVEFAPYVLATGSRFVRGYEDGVNREASLRENRTVWRPLWSGGLQPKWILANTSLSVATGAKEGSGTSTDRISAGIKVPLFDEGDPRLNVALVTCYRGIEAGHPVRPRPDPKPVLLPDPPPTDADRTQHAADLKAWEKRQKLRETRPELPADATEAQKQQYAVDLALHERLKSQKDEDIKPLYQDCLKTHGKAPWNASSAALAFAQIWTDGGTERRAKYAREARHAWASYASDLGTRGGDRQSQLVLQARIVRDAIDTEEEVAEGQAPRKYKSNAAGLRFRMGSPESNGDIAASIERRKYSDGVSERVRLGAIGYEFKLYGDFWLKLSGGYERREKSGNNPFVLTSIKWGTNKASDLTPAGMKSAAAP